MSLDDSHHINQNLILLFASWIDRKNSQYNSSREVKYEFKLIYRSSRDGDNGAAFHQKCDNINKTLVVGKIQNSNQLVGGYNPLDWNLNNKSCINKNTTESFIFNISNRNDLNSAQFSCVIKNHDKAIHCCSSRLADFGGGNDLYFNTNSTITINHSSYNCYNNINIVNGSRYDELEVFQIINKK